MFRRRQEKGTKRWRLPESRISMFSFESKSDWCNNEAIKGCLFATECFSFSSCLSVFVMRLARCKELEEGL